MVTNRTIMFLWMVFMSWGGVVYCQNTADIEVRVEVDPDTVLMDNTFYLTYTIKGAGNQFEAPDFHNFDMVSQSSGSSISIVNGETNRTATYTFMLRPHSPGLFVIDPATVRTKDGTIVETPPIEINVYPNPTGRKIIPRRKEEMDFFGRDFQIQYPFDDFFGFGDKDSRRERRAPRKQKKKRYKF